LAEVLVNGAGGGREEGEFNHGGHGGGGNGSRIPLLRNLILNPFPVLPVLPVVKKSFPYSTSYVGASDMSCSILVSRERISCSVTLVLSDLLYISSGTIKLLVSSSK
jgi:hypothetical protein